MIERGIENWQNVNAEERKFDSGKLAELSKSEIVDLVENNQDVKNEILKNIPNEVYWPKGVDQKLVDHFEYSKEYGFKVGSVKIEEKETGEINELGLYREREKINYNFNDNNKNNNQYSDSLSYKYCLIDNKGRVAGIMNVKNYSNDLLKILIENFSEKLLKKEFNLSKNFLKYGDDFNKDQESFIHVDSIQSFKSGCGTVLHQVAVEHSLREGFGGRNQLYADYFGSTQKDDAVVTSAGFHENFGYFYKDVYNYNEDGKLRHKGEDIHAALAESRWNEAQKWKKEHLGKKMPKSIRDNYRPLAEKSALMAFLPEHVALREKERMLLHQNLRVNLETLDALEEKK